MEWVNTILYGRISGPIVMIGFGSIGRGVLPLIHRHFDYDPKRFVIVSPDATNEHIAAAYGIRFLKKAITPDNYRDLLTPLLTEGGG
ncbi:MAG TPA: saccharopine dehydrogenase NADP-binding domain-containing protein, partial [Micavibrio sp.]|nr:saccharopine dehydrogenase NADP-binding domain-containing protein [Micavibrio sp.]